MPIRCRSTRKQTIWTSALNKLRPRQNGRHFADDIFKCVFLLKNGSIPIKISPNFVPKCPFNNIPALVRIMAWRRCHYLNQLCLVYLCIYVKCCMSLLSCYPVDCFVCTTHTYNTLLATSTFGKTNSIYAHHQSNSIMRLCNLHRLISAATGRWVTSDRTELPFLPGRKKLCTRAVEYNPWVSKGKTQVSLRFIIKIQHINVFHMYDC